MDDQNVSPSGSSNECVKSSHEFIQQAEDELLVKKSLDGTNNYEEYGKRLDLGNDFDLSEFRFLNNQEITKVEFLELRKQITEMMMNMEQIDNILKTEDIENALELEASGEDKKKKIDDSKIDLLSSMKEIEKMDAILIMKVEEEKRAKFDRIQAEEESRSILSSLPSTKVSNGIKLNFEEFMQLLDSEEKSESSSEKETGDKCSEEKDNKKLVQQNPTGLKFIERNIQLARCGRGVLSLTEEEESRVQSLLADIEGGHLKEEESIKETDRRKASKGDGDHKGDTYAFDDNWKLVLSQIDEKLKAFARREKAENEEGESILEEKLRAKEDAGNENETLKFVTGQLNNKPNCLREIDKLLTSINSVCTEEINPISQEEMESLVKQAQKSFSPSGEVEEEEKEPEKQVEEEGILKFRPSQEVIADLVTNAKFLMPKFKYRFDDL